MKDIFQSVNTLLKNNDIETLKKVLQNLTGFEIAEMVSEKIEEEQIAIFKALSPEKAADTFNYLSVRNQKRILHSLNPSQTAEMLHAMSPDDRTALLQELPTTTVKEFIRLLPVQEGNLALNLLAYPEGSIGRFMTTDYISVKMNWTIERVLDQIRAYGFNTEIIDVIYVVNDENILLDDIRIKDLFFVPRDYKVAQIADYKFVALSVNDQAEQAISIFKEYDRVALPVVNERGTMLGIVTIDDILRLESDMATENIQKMGGSEALDEPYLETPFLTLIKKRARWLVLLFLGESLTATAMGYFEGEIEKAVVLALFLPLIISSGGNSGSQSTTLIIRALALEEISLKDWSRIMKKELFAGLALGTILGCVGFFRVSAWSIFTTIYGEHWLLVAWTLFLALIGVVLWGSLIGAMLPFLLKKLGFDPAVASAPLVATLVDVTGIIIYFFIAMMTLKGSLL